MGPMPKHGSIWLYVHGNQKAREDGQSRTATSTHTHTHTHTHLRTHAHSLITAEKCMYAGGWLGFFFSSLFLSRKWGFSAVLNYSYTTFNRYRTEFKLRRPVSAMSINSCQWLSVYFKSRVGHATRADQNI